MVFARITSCILFVMYLSTFFQAFCRRERVGGSGASSSSNPVEHLGLKNHLTHFDYFCMLTARSTCRVTFAWCLLGLFLAS